MSNWHPAGKLSEFAAIDRKVIEIDERMIVLLRVGNDVFALEDLCTHDDGPLSDGDLDAHSIACPRHGAKFDLRTGKQLSMPATKPTKAFPVDIRGDEIFVEA